MKTIEFKNRKAVYDFFIGETLECGIVLTGNEIKTIRAGHCNFKDAWVTVQNGELVIRGMNIPQWFSANQFDIDENRERKLLAHKSEIRKIENKLKLREGLTYVPLEVYINENGKCKVLIAEATGKHKYDKRQAIKEADIKREQLREVTIRG